MKDFKGKNTGADELEKKVKDLEGKLSIYRVEADKSLANKDELSEKELKKLAEEEADDGDIHFDCKRQIKILKTQNFILEKRDKKHIARREELTSLNLQLEDKYTMLDHLNKRTDKINSEYEAKLKENNLLN